ncbi:hypothetical protein HCN44_009360 [Aphidius gifuensis]|uniref:Uncharacterized protein n=1 Tax=Aphidius gifuensis TaxID=684658 RepID=A0A834Y501_APHGI|nr:uncharacterized protein LOC122860154 [Aphidius gifuensis]KAF7997962.1 hypothetical protein HCN44_009360 [Aphidius gifuensis]
MINKNKINCWNCKKKRKMKFKKLILFLALLVSMKNGTSYCLEISNKEDNKYQSLILPNHNVYLTKNLTKLWDRRIGMLGIISLEESEYLDTIWSNIIDEYQSYMAEFKRLGKNYNSCFKFFKEILSRALTLSMRSNNDCLNVHRTNYTDTVSSKIRSVELETIFPHCYPHYTTREILTCLDDSSKNKSTIEHYDNAFYFIKNYHHNIFKPMRKCIANINTHINESILYSKNEFEYCIQHQESVEKKNDTFDILIDDNLKSIDNSYQKAVDDIKMKFQKNIENYVNNSFGYYDTYENLTCCSYIPKNFLIKKKYKIMSDSEKCFDMHLVASEYFNNSISKANDLELFTKSCSQDDILSCNETEILPSDTFRTIYNSIKINMIKESKISILNIYNCLDKIQQRFSSIVNYANFQFDLCVYKQYNASVCQVHIANDNWLFGFIWNSSKIPNLG